MKNTAPNCASFPYKIEEWLCREENGKHPNFSPTQNRPELVEQSVREYVDNPYWGRW